MRIALVLSIILLTTACDNAGDKVAKQYALAEANGDGLDDLCSLAERAAAKYLKAEDQENYAVWKSKAQAKCAASEAASDRELEREMREYRRKGGY